MPGSKEDFVIRKCIKGSFKDISTQIETWDPQHASTAGPDRTGRCNQGEEVFQITRTHVMKGFKDQNQHLDLNLEANW